ncbi:MAG TPA: iron ABC transporter permease [Candidatus Polarisedimenticolaceae bacterium]|nr:iron ABC transporter permease [Candidatus Polarisedimenticolaceae bacterium]
MTAATISDAVYGYARGTFKGEYLWHWIILIAVGLAVLTPLTFLVLGSFSLATLPTEFTLSELSFKNYEKVWLDRSTYVLFYNTLVYVTGATAFGITVAAGLAWLVERTNISGKIWIYAGVPMTLAMPGMLQAMAYVLLLSPRIGYLNELLGVFAIGPINIYSLSGMIFIEGLRLVPTAFLMLVPLLRAMDPALEEAAFMSGANPRRTLRRVTIRLMLPGLLAVFIYQCMTALEVFEVPGILGLPASIYVFSTKIYSVLHSVSTIPAYGQANALAMIYVVIAIGATWIYAKVISKSERFTIITGKGYRPRELDLGKGRWLALGAVLLFLTFSIILPFLVLAYVSFLPFLQSPSLAALQMMTVDHYVQLWNTPLIGRVMMNTVYMVVITSTLTVVISFLVSLVIIRSKFWGRKILDQLAFMPHAIPGIVMGLAFLWVFLQGTKYGINLYGGIWAISIAFAVGFMAYGTRSMNAALLQIHKDLEEAAQTSGATPWRTMWRIFCPLMLPTFVGVWVWSMLHAVRIAGKPLLLYEGSENQVLAVLIWNMWDEGNIEGVGAIGTLMIVFLLLVTLGLRMAGFGRGVAIQQSDH